MTKSTSPASQRLGAQPSSTHSSLLDNDTRTGDVVERVPWGSVRGSARNSRPVLEVDSTHDVGAAFVRIFDEFRHRYLLNDSPQSVSPGGWHELEATVRARAGYMVRSEP